MNLTRMGTLVDSDPMTGNNLVLELDRQDIADLADPGRAYVTNRFAGMRDAARFMRGWSEMDKAHVWLKEPDHFVLAHTQPITLFFGWRG